METQGTQATDGRFLDTWTEHMAVLWAEVCGVSWQSSQKRSSQESVESQCWAGGLSHPKKLDRGEEVSMTPPRKSGLCNKDSSNRGGVGGVVFFLSSATGV